MPMARANSGCFRVTDFFPSRKRVATSQQDEYCGKRRRLSGSELEEVPQPQGYIVELLPPLLQEELFAIFSVESLIRLWYTSPGTRESLVAYFRTRRFKDRMVADLASCPADLARKNDMSNPCRRYGDLLKLMSISEHTEDRIELLCEYVEYGMNIAHFQQWGAVITSFCDYWDFGLCIGLLRKVLSWRDGWIRKEVVAVLGDPHGENPDAEMLVNQILRDLFIDREFCDRQSQVFWTTTLLYELSTKATRAKLLLILFQTPKKTTSGREFLDWQELSSLPFATRRDAETGLSRLSEAFELLLDTELLSGSGDGLLTLSTGEVFNLLEETTTTPAPWCLDNFIALHLVSPRLFAVSCLPRLKNGHFDETAEMLANISSLAINWRFDYWGQFGTHLEQLLKAMEPDVCKQLVGAIYKAMGSLVTDAFREGRAAQINHEVAAHTKISISLQRIISKLVI
ncbi:unnamed protein product, partial [Mesorhabditis spiculigera]